MSNGHLTDEEFAELLLETWDGARVDAGAGRGAHLAECLECREELEQVRGALTAWGRVSLAEAEVRAGALGGALGPAAVREVAVRWRPAPSWWAAAAAAVVAVVLVGSGHLHTTGGARGGAVQSGAKQEIEEDNQLLSNIDAELHWQQGGAVQMPAGSLGGRREGGSRTE